MARAALLVPLALALGCAPAHLIGQRPPRDPISAGPPRVVIIEPLFDRAEWKTSVKTDVVAAPGSFATGFGSMGTGDTVTVTKTITEKPLFARPQTLAAIHQQLLPAIAILRPNWTVIAPSAAPTQVKRDATVVRTVIDGNEVTQTDRPLKNAAFAFGLVLLPLQILAAFPVEETQRISGLLERIELDPQTLQGRLVKYATQPDFAVNFSGIAPKQQNFALDVEYEEGLFADETPRPAVLVEGFVEKLAYAIVAFVEEEKSP